MFTGEYEKFFGKICDYCFIVCGSTKVSGNFLALSLSDYSKGCPSVF